MKYRGLLTAVLLSSGVVAAGDAGVMQGMRVPELACYRGGCSGELCTSRARAMSPCIFKPTYRCYQKATCEKQSDGGCGFTVTPELNRCLSDATQKVAPEVQ